MGQIEDRPNIDDAAGGSVDESGRGLSQRPFTSFDRITDLLIYLREVYLFLGIVSSTLVLVLFVQAIRGDNPSADIVGLLKWIVLAAVGFGVLELLFNSFVRPPLEIGKDEALRLYRGAIEMSSKVQARSDKQTLQRLSEIVWQVSQAGARRGSRKPKGAATPHERGSS